MAVTHNYLETSGYKPTAAETAKAELVVNLADGTLWTENGAGTVIEVAASSPAGGVGITNTFEYVATASQTIFTGADINTTTLSYVAGNIYVIVDGFHLSTSDYTATNGTSVTLTTGLAAGQELSIVAFDEFSLVSSGALTVSGNLTVNGTITENSARKYKENIKPITGALDSVMQLEGVTYTKKESSQVEMGLIADDVLDILPHVVDVRDGEVEGLNYSRIVAVLIESVKELKAEIEELKNG